MHIVSSFFKTNNFMKSLLFWKKDTRNLQHVGLYTTSPMFFSFSKTMFARDSLIMCPVNWSPFKRRKNWAAPEHSFRQIDPYSWHSHCPKSRDWNHFHRLLLTLLLLIHHSIARLGSHSGRHNRSLVIRRRRSRHSLLLLLLLLHHLHPHHRLF